jgi:single stranded DNA-binding protein
MATISVAGSVTAKEGEDAVTLRTFDNGNQIASFSVLDREYFYVKQGEERKGQFYRVEVIGKAAEIATNRLKRGDKVAVSGQFVSRDYNDKTYYDIKNARVTYMEAPPERDGGGYGGPPSEEEVPF